MSGRGSRGGQRGRGVSDNPNNPDLAFRPRGRGRGQGREDYSSRGRGRGQSNFRPTEGADVFAPGYPAQLDQDVGRSEDRLHASLQRTLSPLRPARPAYGSQGRQVLLWANYFQMNVDKSVSLYRYSVEVKGQHGGQKVPGKLCKRILQLLIDENLGPGRYDAVSDFRASLITLRQLDLPEDGYTVTYRAEEEDAPASDARSYVVEAKYVDTLSLSALLNSATSSDVSSLFGTKQELIQALNLVVGHKPKTTLASSTIGRNRHVSSNTGPADRAPLGGGLEAIRAFVFSVRAATERILINVHIKNLPFLEPGPLDRIVQSFLSYYGSSRFALAAFLKGVSVDVLHIRKTNRSGQRIPRYKTIVGLAARSDGKDLPDPPIISAYGSGARDVKFLLEAGGPSSATTDPSTRKSGKGKKKSEPVGKSQYISVYDFFKQRYNTTITDPNLPVINVGTTAKPSYLPMQVCEVRPGQLARGRLTPAQTQQMIRFAVRKPAQNASSIVTSGLSLLGLEGSNPYLDAFGLSVEPRMITVPGRVMQPPSITYAANQTMRPANGNWNLTSSRLFRGVTVERWTYLLVSPEQSRPIWQTPQEFQECLSRFTVKLNALGIRINQHIPGMRVTVKPGDPENKLEDALHKFATNQQNRPQLTLVVIPQTDATIYNRVKYICDVKEGLANICMVDMKFAKANDQYFANVGLKMNLKLGGCNHALNPSELGPISAKDTMFVGIDVTHPSPGSTSTAPSVAGIVGSVDEFLAQWPAELRIQEARKEMVDALDELLQGCLRRWQKRNRSLPRKIVVYRDGVSEGQYQTVLDNELPALRKATQAIYPATDTKAGIPRLAIVVVGKRHHTRFYATDKSNADRSGNPQSGTVVDRGVTEVANWDFFMQAHSAIQGTARPAHYYVIYDEIFRQEKVKLPLQNAADLLEKLSHNLCYLFGRATKAVSVCPPAYYADLVCERARCYLAHVYAPTPPQSSAASTMDTGSGKTQVAILRIQAELDRCPRDKRIWFLAPTVELCIQQHRVLSAALPAYAHRLLTGSDNVDRWSNKTIWDAALDQHRVVVSTHAVLADALAHGFVPISTLALIVFDEAHHCVKKHPANIIMRDFYHPTKTTYGSPFVPHILGLSASLVMRSNLGSMQVIENNLDSTSVTPRIHREDLLRHVHRPDCQLLQYRSTDDIFSPNGCESLKDLIKLRDSSMLTSVPGDHGSDGVCSDQNPQAATILVVPRTVEPALRLFCRKAEHIYANLGSWATDYYIHQTIKTLDEGNGELWNELDTQGPHRRVLLSLFGRCRIQSLCQDHLEPGDDSVSPKVKCLLSFLCGQADKTAGIVFVQQRATTTVLSALLNRHPATRDRLRCAPFVGTSNAPSRTYGLTDLTDIKAQKDALSEFRNGTHNVIVATNALEEGIDVQSCNVVACFDLPANVKSFIQRRGRARHVQSKLGLLVSATGERELISKWQSLEEELTKICQSDRERAHIAELFEDQEEVIDYALEVPSTRAKVTADNAVQHLHHFCNRLPHRAHVDLKPVFSCEEDGLGLIEATVVLPNCLSVQIRQAKSQRRWRTERTAKRDAAFHAYKAIYQAGLLNDHLLPLSQSADLIEDGSLEEDETGMTNVPAQIDVWLGTDSGSSNLAWHETVVTLTPPDKLREDGEPEVRLLLWTPRRVPVVQDLVLHWSSEHAFRVKFGRSIASGQPSNHEEQVLRDVTLLFYTSPRSERSRTCRKDFSFLLRPHLRHETLEQWLQRSGGTREVKTIVGFPLTSLVRVPYPNKPPYAFMAWSISTQGPVVHCKRLPRRREFLVQGAPKPQIAPSIPGNHDSEPQLETFPAHECTFDSLPMHWARVGLFLPAFFYHMHDSMVAERLKSDILKVVNFRDREHIVTAICAPSAKRRTNYQSYEYLGDSILKFAASCHFFASQPHWHEGMLTVERSKLVSNSNLAQAAIRTGLPSFIILEGISHRDWTIPVFSNNSMNPTTRQISSKTLADVVEALIGAAWLDSGLEAALTCINIFIPSIPSSMAKFAEMPQPVGVDFSTADEAQLLIGYTFNKPALLLEALTHASCGGFCQVDSYQRLEYLGDAVLDMLVARQMAKRAEPISPGRMTHLKAALVNARLLGYCCLALRHPQTLQTPRTDQRGHVTIEKGFREVHLATYLRAQSTSLSAALQACQDRYDLNADVIKQELETGMQYPWTELLRLRPDKFLSDVVESILGAIFVDSGGDMLPCHLFLERLGLIQYLDRMIREEVDVLHPRDRLQRWAGDKKITFDVQRAESDGRYMCSVFVENGNITDVDGCWDREEAVAFAACQAEQNLSAKGLAD